MTNVEKIIIGELAVCLGFGLICLGEAMHLMNKRVHVLELEVGVAETHIKPRNVDDNRFDPDRRIIGFTANNIR